MIIRFSKKILYLAILLCTSIGIHKTAQAEKIIFACSPWPPFTARDLPNYGVLGHVFQEAAARGNVDIEIDFMPWNRAVTLVKKGQIAGLFCSNYSEERTKWLHFTEESFLSPAGGFFMRQDNLITWDKLSDLKGKSIGVLKSGYSEEYLTAHSKGQLTIKSYANELAGMRMLAGGRYDLILMSKVDGLLLLEQKLPESKDKIIYQKNLYVTEMRPSIGHKWENGPDILKKIDQGYRSLKADGQLAEIYRQHNFKP